MVKIFIFNKNINNIFPSPWALGKYQLSVFQKYDYFYAYLSNYNYILDFLNGLYENPDHSMLR